MLGFKQLLPFNFFSFKEKRKVEYISDLIWIAAKKVGETRKKFSFKSEKLLKKSSLEREKKLTSLTK